MTKQNKTIVLLIRHLYGTDQYHLLIQKWRKQCTYINTQVYTEEASDRPSSEISTPKAKPIKTCLQEFNPICHHWLPFKIDNKKQN